MGWCGVIRDEICVGILRRSYMGWLGRFGWCGGGRVVVLGRGLCR